MSALGGRMECAARQDAAVSQKPAIGMLCDQSHNCAPGRIVQGWKEAGWKSSKVRTILPVLVAAPRVGTSRPTLGMILPSGRLRTTGGTPVSPSGMILLSMVLLFRSGSGSLRSLRLARPAFVCFACFAVQVRAGAAAGLPRLEDDAVRSVPPCLCGESLRTRRAAKRSVVHFTINGANPAPAGTAD